MAQKSDRFQIAALVGSLRERSYNRALLRAAISIAPEEVLIFEVPIGSLPHFDQDLELGETPGTVSEMRTSIASADAVLFVTPEYNYSVPGVLKNAIDWASRPSGASVLRGKPTAIMGVASGRSGTIRAQMHLRQILLSVGMPDLQKPEVYVSYASEHFDEDGVLIDKDVEALLSKQIIALVEWSNTLRAGETASQSR